MVKTSIGLLDELKEYTSPKSKITRLLKERKLIQIKRGLYLDSNDKTYSLKGLSGIIYGPSYVSFETALSYYGLIPEAVYRTTCASYGKNRNKVFETAVGDFYYYHIPHDAYSSGINIKQEAGYNFQIATPEKAVLDLIYRYNPDVSELKEFLFDDMRIDEEELMKQNPIEIQELAVLYRRRACTAYSELFRKELKYA